MPNSFISLSRALRDALTQRPKKPVTPGIDPDAPSTPGFDPAEALAQRPSAKPVTPGFNPDAPGPPLTGYWNPDAPMPPVIERQNPPMVTPAFNPAEALNAPAAMSPKPEQPPPHWYKTTPGKSVGGAPLQSAEEGDFLHERGMIRPKNKFSFKERLIEGLKSGAVGALQGLAQTGNWKGALGGFAGGAGAGAYDPRVGARMRFSSTVEPGLAAQRQHEQQEAEARAALENRQLDNRYREAQVGRIDLQNQMDRAEEARRALEAESKAKRGGFIETSPGATLYDVNTGKPAFTAPGRPQAQAERKPSGAELTVDPSTGLSVEEMAEASYQNRGGDGYVLSKMPADIRRVLENEIVVEDGQERRATRKEITAARSDLDRAIKRQRDTDLRYTRGAIRAKRVTGAAPLAQPSAAKPQSKAQPTARRKAAVGADFVNHVANTLKISPEEARRRIEADGYQVR